MKKNKTLLIIIIVIALIVVIGIGYYLINKNSNSGNGNNEPPRSITKEVNVDPGRYSSTKELNEYLRTYFAKFTNCNTGFYKGSLSTYTPYNLDKEIIYTVAYNYLLKNGKIKFDKTIDTNSFTIDYNAKSETNTFSKNDLQDAIKSLFGKEFASKFSIDDNIYFGEIEYTLSDGNYSGPTPDLTCNNKKSIGYNYITDEGDSKTYSLVYSIYWYEHTGGGNVNFYESPEYNNPISAIEDLKFGSRRASLNFELEDGNYILKNIKIYDSDK